MHGQDIVQYGQVEQENIFLTIMKQIINIIKAHIAECKSMGNMFDLPQIDIDGVDVTKESLKGDGATLYHDVYDIKLADGQSIHIDYKSKDQCRSYQVRPDRSKIEISCSNQEHNFNDAWDENS